MGALTAVPEDAVSWKCSYRNRAWLQDCFNCHSGKVYGSKHTLPGFIEGELWPAGAELGVPELETGLPGLGEGIPGLAIPALGEVAF